jgi:Glycosyltransferase family 87
VTIAQIQLPTRVWTQPFLSPPPVAWMVAPLTPLPYPVSFFIWAALTLAAFIAAVAWSTYYRGTARLVAVGAAVAPWWVFAAVNVGQVAPLIAAGVLVAWRLLREERDIWAGLVLTVVLLKPNTALLAPIALAFAGRFKAFGAWVAASAVIVLISLVSLGEHGTAAYIDDLIHMPTGILHSAAVQTIEGSFGLTGAGAVVLRLVIVVAALASAYRFRKEPWLAMVAGAMASLTVATYLHPSDICLFVASGWILWHERHSNMWRGFIAALWFVTLPFLRIVGAGLPLNRWILLELAFLAALCADSWMRGRARSVQPEPLTATADIGKRLTA